MNLNLNSICKGAFWLHHIFSLGQIIGTTHKLIASCIFSVENNRNIQKEKSYSLFARLANGHLMDKLFCVLCWWELNFTPPFLLGSIFSQILDTFSLHMLPNKHRYYSFTFPVFFFSGKTTHLSMRFFQVSHTLAKTRTLKTGEEGGNTEVCITFFF